jgi:hypothetical protein
MPTRRGDKWEARLKLAGRVVRTQRFDTKRAATEWERRQRSAFEDHGYDPSRGKVAVEELLAAWLEAREARVSRTTLNTDRFLLPTAGQRSGRSGTETILPTWFRKLHAVKVTGAAIQQWQDELIASRVTFLVFLLVRLRGLHRCQPREIDGAPEGPSRA